MTSERDQSIDAPRLKTETNSPSMRRRIHAAVWKMGYREFQLDFEHGQWWVTSVRSGAQWSVCDATGGDSVDGFILEQVTEGEEE